VAGGSDGMQAAGGDGRASSGRGQSGRDERWAGERRRSSLRRGQEGMLAQWLRMYVVM
jgi:hypothetical protein